MAIRLVVEFIDLQVSIQSQEVSASVELAQNSAPSLVTSTTDVGLEVQNQVIAPIRDELVSFLSLNLETTFVNLQAQIFIDSDTKNLYFYAGHPNAEIINLSEQAALGFSKTLADAFGMGEQITAFSFGLGKTDSVSLLSDPRLAVSVAKADQFSVAEQHSLGVAKPASDSFGVSESSNRGTGLGKSDSVSMPENLTRSPNLGKSDSIPMTESLARTVSYNRSFTDAFTLDDLASFADPLQTDSGLNKSNIATLSEEHQFAFTKTASDTFAFTDTPALSNSLAATDTVSLSEADVISLSKVEADSFAVAESISILLTVGGSSVLNTAALNSNALN